MIQSSIDLGQIIISSAIIIIGFFVRHELSRLTTRLDDHDDRLNELLKDVSRLVGQGQAQGEWNKRHSP